MWTGKQMARNSDSGKLRPLLAGTLDLQDRKFWNGVFLLAPVTRYYRRTVAEVPESRPCL